ncbi:hypothetical protein QE152_g25041 [Popillia japonica]|uniref:Uncharacterized protein n=1 Tax=Popillia japonica TaxID=7064 RepID=A0AAW1K2T6_POPJA
MASTSPKCHHRSTILHFGNGKKSQWVFSPGEQCAENQNKQSPLSSHWTLLALRFELHVESLKLRFVSSDDPIHEAPSLFGLLLPNPHSKQPPLLAVLESRASFRIVRISRTIVLGIDRSSATILTDIPQSARIRSTFPSELDVEGRG